MDLRAMLTTEAAIERGCEVLNYQPFILSDDIQTGAAYSWVYGVNTRTDPPVIFRREDYGSEEWGMISDSNERLRRMYDDFVSFIASQYSGGTFLDVACNNGYFPVQAELMGMKKTFGADGGLHFARSVAFLNETLGTNAEFIHALYDPRAHDAPIYGENDVVSASAILCHLPDPLEFLAMLGALATKAIFYFGQVVDTDDLLISYLRPHPDLALRGISMEFPHRFNDVTRTSRGLLFHAFEEMGFTEIVELPWSDEWLSPYFSLGQRDPFLENESREDVQRAWRLQSELSGGSKHIAVLASRPPGQLRRTLSRKRMAARYTEPAPPSGHHEEGHTGQASEAGLAGLAGRMADLWRQNLSPLLAPPLDILPILERTTIATDSDGATVMVKAKADSGHFLFGPYIRLDPGNYELAFVCYAEVAPKNAATLVTVEVVAGDAVIASESFAKKDTAPRSPTLSFRVTGEISKLGPKIEFRFSHHGQGDLEISQITLRSR